jgi:cyclic-di-AMP phosphodiesterase PgpH
MHKIYRSKVKIQKATKFSMKKFLDKTFERIPHFAKYLLVLGAVMALSFLFPTNAKFKYRFNVGQQWLYDDLYANIDYAINKTDRELLDDKAVLARDFSPFYEVDLDVIKEQKKVFLTAFNEQLKRNRAQFSDVVKNTEGYLNYGNYVLEKLLSKGILKPDTLIQNRDKDFVINVLRGNVAEKQTVQNLLTIETAKAWLTDTLPYARLREPEFLLPLLEANLVANLSYNASKTREYKQQELDKISASRGMVKSGELIVPKNGIITPATYQKLLSYKEQYESDYSSSRKFLVILLGYSLLCGLILSLFMIYLSNHLYPVFIKLRWVLFLLLWIVLYSYLMYGIRASDILNPYLIPFCIAPIVIKNFYNRELAFITHLSVILTVGLINSPGYDFIFLQMLVGIVVVFSKFDTRYWSNFFRSIFTISIVYVIGFIGLSLIEESNFQTFNWSVLVWLSLNGFLTLLAYPLIPLLGSFFGFTSSITLAELSDLNHPLLKELSLKTPGTLQHSLQVANLSEAAAKAIGANDLLVKVAAMYHDIGKTLNSNYFIENQSGMNPHDQLPYIESAKVIIEHVTQGEKMAEKAGLPKVITRFITTHHGTTMVEFFYRKHLKETQNGAIDKIFFQYPGPKPVTKEETILMLADSLEATAKSLKTPDNDSINELVERIVSDKIANGQLQDSELSFNDLEKCKTSFKQTLKNIHHIRIEYPSAELKIKN